MHLFFYDQKRELKQNLTPFRAMIILRYHIMSLAIQLPLMYSIVFLQCSQSTWFSARISKTTSVLFLLYRLLYTVPILYDTASRTTKATYISTIPVLYVVRVACGVLSSISHNSFFIICAGNTVLYDSSWEPQRRSNKQLVHRLRTAWLLGLEFYSSSLPSTKNSCFNRFKPTLASVSWSSQVYYTIF